MPRAPALKPRRRPRIGLAASAAHRHGSAAALFRLFAPIERAVEETLRPELFVVGRTWAAITDGGLFTRYDGLHRLPDRRDGGVVRLCAMLVDDDPARALDAIVYLLDPDDPTSVFPEGQALKRQCVVHGKPFVSTLAHAQEWFELALCAAGAPPDPLLDARFDPEGEAIALVAHDARKDAMVAFASEHFGLLSRFPRRFATGTTGARLNAMAAARGAGADWVHRLKSGPLGGDAQLADLILDRGCSRVVFFEDPHVARQHEADIQLLERAARIATDYASCVNDPRTAATWAVAFERRMKLRRC